MTMSHTLYAYYYCLYIESWLENVFFIIIYVNIDERHITQIYKKAPVTDRSVHNCYNLGDTAS